MIPWQLVWDSSLHGIIMIHPLVQGIKLGNRLGLLLYSVISSIHRIQRILVQKSLCHWNHSSHIENERVVAWQIQRFRVLTMFHVRTPTSRLTQTLGRGVELRSRGGMDWNANSSQWIRSFDSTHEQSTHSAPRRLIAILPPKLAKVIGSLWLNYEFLRFSSHLLLILFLFAVLELTPLHLQGCENWHHLSVWKHGQWLYFGLFNSFAIQQGLSPRETKAQPPNKHNWY